MEKPTIQELVSVVTAYNAARELELRAMPAGGWPAGYKNEFMDSLYDAACLAAAQLKPILALPSLNVAPPQ